MAALITGAVVVVLLGVYGLMTLSRRGRIRRAADELGAAYFPEGVSGLGRIVGQRYTISFSKLRRSFFTDLQVRAPGTPGNYVIDAPFFEGWPDWAHVKVPDKIGMRAFVVEVRIPGYRPPNEAEREALWRWLHRGSTARRLPSNLLAAAQLRRISIGDGVVTMFFKGIVTDTARLRPTLDLLERLASDGSRAAREVS
jgi:hypothetical protein